MTSINGDRLSLVLHGKPRDVASEGDNQASPSLVQPRVPLIAPSGSRGNWSGMYRLWRGSRAWNGSSQVQQKACAEMPCFPG